MGAAKPKTKPSTIQRVVTAIDAVTDLSGRSIAWLTLLMMLVTTAIVILRYVFNIGSIAVQESVTYLHATVFMLGAAYTLKRQGHVRVDIFYRKFSTKTQALVNCIGSLLLLLPTCGFMVWISLDYVATSWSIRESSQEAGGLPAVFLLKTLIPLMGLMLILQGVAEFLRHLLLFSEDSADIHPDNTGSGI